MTQVLWMSSRTTPATVVAVALVLLGSGPAAATDARLGPFDFAYRIAGDREARPLQVFDDGGRTYFQFRPGAPIPAMVAGPHGDPVRVAAEGPYVVAPGVARAYTLQQGRHRATVVSVDPGGRGAMVVPDAAVASPVGDPGTPANPSAGAPAPARAPSATTRGAGAEGRTGAYAAPVRGDVLGHVAAWAEGEQTVTFTAGAHRLSASQALALARVAAAAGGGAAFEVHAPDGALAQRRRGVVVQALVRAGVQAARLRLRAGPPALALADAVWVTWRSAPAPAPAPASASASAPTAPVAVARDTAAPPVRVSTSIAAAPPSGRPLPHHFDILLPDRTVSAVLHRWGRQAGYRVEWNTSVDAPVLGELTVDALDFPSAVERVVGGLRRSGYPVEHTVDGNRVVRVTARPPQAGGPLPDAHLQNITQHLGGTTR